MTRFELATPATRTQCATRLRYIPKIFNFVPNLAVCQVRYPSRKNNSQDCFFSAECYIPRYSNFMPNLMVCQVRYPSQKNNSQSCFFSAECYIPFLKLGWKDSNLRMPGPKPGALPLGDIPISQLLLYIINLCCQL